jgi:hypothetical protein
MGFEDVPVWLGDMILSFLAVDGRNAKWAIDECILMCQINLFLKWMQFVPSGLILQSSKESDG